jgi:hypothetical protein
MDSTGKPPSTDNSIPVMKLLFSDARNTAPALAKTIFEVLRIIAVLGAEC